MKFILTAILSVALFSTAFAGTESASASQTIQLTLAPVIQIQNNMVVNNTNNTFTVKSNSGFTVNVTTESTTTKNLIADNKNHEQSFALNIKAKNNSQVIYTATQP